MTEERYGRSSFGGEYASNPRLNRRGVKVCYELRAVARSRSVSVSARAGSAPSWVKCSWASWSTVVAWCG